MSASASTNTSSGKDVEQFHADTKLFASYEAAQRGSENLMNYAEAVGSSSGIAPDEQIHYHLSKFIRGNQIQPFGCLICIQESSFRILAYSENTVDFLKLAHRMALTNQECLLGLDARTLFSPSSVELLTKALLPENISLLNPILVVTQDDPSEFFAIIHRIDVGFIIDFEPTVNVEDVFLVCGAHESQKFGTDAVSRLLSLSHESINGLCDALVKIIKDFTNYDRVMIYKFDDEGHGEVLSEDKRDDLEPYLGLHYPATDIPLVARILFKQNRARVIVDTLADPVRIIQSDELGESLLLSQSTLRAPHGCHSQYMGNMSSMSSLVLPISVHGNRVDLWGLVACHHATPLYLPFPLRSACVFIVKAFESLLRLKLQLVNLVEKNDGEQKLFKSQGLLGGIDIPFVMSRSPNIINLVNCNGAAVYSDGVSQVMGVTPSSEQIQDIIAWLLSFNSNMTIWTTNSLVVACYPNASMLGDVCGMAIIRITSSDFLLWFRSKAEIEIKWGNSPYHITNKDDGKQMHPSSSSKVFTEVIKYKSLSWKNWEKKVMWSAKIAVTQKNLSLAETKMMQLFEKSAVPIFAVDSIGIVIKWNLKMVELTGCYPSEVLGRSTINELVQEECREDFEHCLVRARRGEDGNNIKLRLKACPKNQGDEWVSTVVNAYPLKNHEDNVIRVYFMCQDLNEVEEVSAEIVCLQAFLSGELTCLREDYKNLTQTEPELSITQKVKLKC